MGPRLKRTLYGFLSCTVLEQQYDSTEFSFLFSCSLVADVFVGVLTLRRLHSVLRESNVRSRRPKCTVETAGARHTVTRPTNGRGPEPKE